MQSKYKYSDEQVKEAVAKARSFADAVRILTGSTSGASYVHFKKRVIKLGYDTSHFNPNWNQSEANKQSLLKTKLRPKDVFIYSRRENGKREKSEILRRILIEVGVPLCCNICKLASWLDKPITLQIDHKDGNYLNNLQDNLQFLCPNCHSQTENFGFNGKNQKAGVNFNK